MALLKLLKLNKITILTYIIISLLTTSYYFFFLKKQKYYNKHIYGLNTFQLDNINYSCIIDINFTFVGIENFLEKKKNKSDILRYKIFVNRDLVFEIETITNKKKTNFKEFNDNLNNYLNSSEYKIFLKNYEKNIIVKKKETFNPNLNKEQISKINKTRGNSEVCKKKLILLDSYQSDVDGYIFFFSMNISILFFLVLSNWFIQNFRKKL